MIVLLRRCRIPVLLGLLCLHGDLAAVGQAKGQVVAINNRDALQLAIRNAQPGTKILIAPGEYEGGLQFNQVSGTAQQPIIVSAADKSHPPVFRGGGSGIHFANAVHLELHSLVLVGARGNGLNMDDGGSPQNPSRHILLKNLVVRDVGPDGNRDGIKLSGLDDFRIEDCVIERWGNSGSAIDMVGCHQGRITGCTFRYRGNLAANGVQTKGGSRNIVIQRCRFENAGGRAVNIGGSTGLAYFRPKVQGYEAKDIVVEDCTIIGSMAPICFVGVDGAEVRHNTIYRPSRYVLRILQENTDEAFVPCRNGRFTNNLIAYRSDETHVAVNTGPHTLPESFLFSGNHWYCLDQPENSDRLSRSLKESDGKHGEDPQFVNADQGDLRKRTRGAGVRELDR